MNDSGEVGRTLEALSLSGSVFRGRLSVAVEGCPRLLFGVHDDQSGDEVDGDRLFEHVDDQDPRCDREEPAILVHLFPAGEGEVSVSTGTAYVHKGGAYR